MPGCLERSPHAALQEADWLRYAEELVKAHAVAKGEEGNTNVAGGLSLTLTPGTGDAAKEVYLSVREGQDTSHAAFDFCAAHGLHSADDIAKIEPMLREKLERDSVTVSPRPPLTGSAFVAAAKAAAKLGDFAAAGADYSRAMHTADLSAADLEIARAGVVEMMQARRPRERLRTRMYSCVLVRAHAYSNAVRGRVLVVGTPRRMIGAVA
jgi:hypothetical protein